MGESRDADATVRRRMHQRGLHSHDGEGRAVQRRGPLRYGRLPRRVGVPRVHTPPDSPQGPHHLQPSLARAPLHGQGRRVEDETAEVVRTVRVIPYAIFGYLTEMKE